MTSAPVSPSPNGDIVSEASRPMVRVRHRVRVTGPGQSRRVPRWAVCLLMGAVWLSASFGLRPVEAQEPAPQAGGAYRRPLAGDPSTLDPPRMRDIFSLAVGQQL